jgi:hypothetical protein
MHDLDIIAKTGTYFRRRNWKRRRHHVAKIAMAVEALGGTFSIAWAD